MRCIHGLDEVNCPICRMTISTLPRKFLESKDPRENKLRPQTLRYEKNVKKQNTLKHRLPQKEQFAGLKQINSIPKTPFLRDIPNFKNRMFEKRLKEIDISNPDSFNISKKVQFPDAELDLKEFKKKDQ